MNTLMIIFTMALYNGKPVNITHTVDMVNAATCASAQRSLAIRDVPGTNTSIPEFEYEKVHVVVKCIPMR